MFGAAGPITGVATDADGSVTVEVVRAASCVGPGGPARLRYGARYLAETVLTTAARPPPGPTGGPPALRPGTGRARQPIRRQARPDLRPCAGRPAGRQQAPARPGARARSWTTTVTTTRRRGYADRRQDPMNGRRTTEQLLADAPERVRFHRAAAGAGGRGAWLGGQRPAQRPHDRRRARRADQAGHRRVGVAAGPDKLGKEIVRIAAKPFRQRCAEHENWARRWATRRRTTSALGRAGRPDRADAAVLRRAGVEPTRTPGT